MTECGLQGAADAISVDNDVFKDCATCGTGGGVTIVDKVSKPAEDASCTEEVVAVGEVGNVVCCGDGGDADDTEWRRNVERQGRGLRR